MASRSIFDRFPSANAHVSLCMTTERTNWTAWGFAGAVALPSGRLDLGPNVRIEHVGVDRLHEFGGGAPRPEHPEASWPAYFSALSTQVIVRSSCVISIRTEATTREEAWDRVERIHVPPVVASLAPYGSPVPRIELLRIAKTDTHGIMSESTSRWAGGTLGGFDSRDLTEAEATSVVARHAAGSRFAADICRLYNDAIRQHDLSDLTPRSLGTSSSTTSLLSRPLHAVKRMPFQSRARTSQSRTSRFKSYKGRCRLKPP